MILEHRHFNNKYANNLEKVVWSDIFPLNCSFIILYIIYIYIKKNIKPVLKRSDHSADIDVQQRATLEIAIKMANENHKVYCSAVVAPMMHNASDKK